MTILADVLPSPLRRAVSPYTGIVRSLEECLRVSTEPPLFRVTCDVGRGDGPLGERLDHVGGIGGAGLSREAAAAAAVGEALERYSATYVPRERLVVATAAELGDDAVAPERFALFSERQYARAEFPCRPFRRDTRVAWIEGWTVATGRLAWLPAELVFLGESLPDGCSRIGYATSSGAACAGTQEEALERALCELLERDAFMIAWANRLSLPRLDWSGDDRLVALDRRYFAVTGLTYAVVDLSVIHGLPSFLGVVRARAGVAGAMGVGAGTSADVVRAWWKSLSEAFASREAGVKLTLVAPETTYGPYGEGVLGFDDHIRYYADHARAAGAAFLDASAVRRPVSGVPVLEGATAENRVGALCDRVRRAGSEVYAVDVTSPDVRELGQCVVKVVAPELCALDVPHGARFLGGQRLYRAAYELGLRQTPLTEDDVNPEPHPFP
ncbi:MAG TPA: YcaO-like family protein [Gaiellaceae bacterium]|jgi:ribosomal protein S12 methylthiotransferase accessory factor